MGELIDQLLAFSRLGRQELRAAPVAITEVVDEALATLVQTRADRNVHVMVAPGLPTVRGDRRLLTQVYVNLIDNALKFTRERDPALIEIGVHAPRDGRSSVLFVRDNGAGLDMRYVDKIFGVFQRLNRSEDYEGSGVGLAIVQRIVNRHGGSVWAEGEVGNGCTIYFTLGGSA
jgi:two-component system sensor kinase